MRNRTRRIRSGTFSSLQRFDVICKKTLSRLSRTLIQLVLIASSIEEAGITSELQDRILQLS